MQTDIIEIKKSSAYAVYKKADSKQKELLKELLGSSFIPPVIERIKTFKDACDELKIKPEDILYATYSDYLKNDINNITAYIKLIIIVRILNEGWQPDWSNNNQYKYYPVFDLSKGSDLVYHDCDYWCYANSGVGSRLCFKDQKTAKYAGETFKNLYKEYFLIK